MSLGPSAVLLATLEDFYTRAAVNRVRFRSGRWKAIGRQPGAGD